MADFHHRVGIFLSLTLRILILMMMLVSRSYAQGPPSPGYYPSSKVGPIWFNQYFASYWGSQHQSLNNQGALTIWLDHTTGSGFRSYRPYRSGYFGASIKLQSGYTAGVITSFYLSNTEQHPGTHDEVDIEFLGTTPGKPYTLQTNVYVRGSGDGNIIGREMRFHLWFDPTQGFHHYAILWNWDEIIFFVDDVPIRRYPRKIDATFPQRPMYVYGSIWDASSWATENGKYRANYNYQPFVAKYTDFKIGGCEEQAAAWCHPVASSPVGVTGLSRQQYAAMAWAQRYHKVYDYCQDTSRDRSRTPECY